MRSFFVIDDDIYFYKPSSIKYKRYTYDIGVEWICEEIFRLFFYEYADWKRAHKNYEKLSNIADKELKKKNAHEKLMRRWKAFLNKIDRFLDDDNLVKEELTLILNLNDYSDVIDNRFRVRTEIIDRMVSPGWLRPIIIDPRGLWLALVLGYALYFNEGITAGIDPNSRLYNMLREVWINAVIDIHPFQRGPSHQGTKHCIQVHNHLNALVDYYDINFITPEMGALLSIAAALHDIVKGDIIEGCRDDHAYYGGQVIRNVDAQYFRLEGNCSNFIARIVESHASEVNNPLIGNHPRTRFRIPGAGAPTTCSANNMNRLCALFQMADVMDTTRDRVSEPISAMLEFLYNNPGIEENWNNEETRRRHGRIRLVLDARRGMLALAMAEQTDAQPAMIEVSLTRDPETRRYSITRIFEEDIDLNRTGAMAVLQRDGWPCMLMPRF